MTTKQTTFDFGWGEVPAHQHPNGKGWIAETAHADETAYIGPAARVYGAAQVYGDARVIERLNRSRPAPEATATPSRSFRSPMEH